jgi:cysteine desulfurase/selenocysteine lyase
MTSHAPTGTPAASQAPRGFDVHAVRRDFPILSREVHGRPLVYLDSAASAQKPRQVVDAMVRAMTEEYSNVHRGVHWLSATATKRFEDARAKIQRFVNAREDREIVFTRGATEAINLVASSWGRKNLSEEDEVVVSWLEHHANIVPWQMLRAEKGIALKVVPVDEDGQIVLEEYERLLGSGRVKLVAMTHMSNALGVVTPIKEVIRLAHARGIPVLVDGCQGITHLGVDVQDLDCDFYVFSGHKLYGPTGIGVLYGKAEILSAMPPYQGGGDMISHVSFEETTFKGIPHRFEAGTPAIVEAIGFGAAVDYLSGLGLDAVAAHERDVLAYATQRLQEINSIRIVGTAPDKASILSFTMEGVHPHDLGTILDRSGVAVRAGHHCAQPLMERMGVPATARASFALYNTREEVDALVASLHRAREIFG